jgi:RHS repeat-associated protein
VVTTFAVNNLNQLTNVDSVTYSHDWNGNMTSTREYRSYSYDDENQLTRAEQYQQWRTDFVYPVRYLYLRKTFAGASACRHRDCWCALEGLSHGVNDGQGRLRVRAEYVWLGGGLYPNGETRYIYDGRLVIQERNSSNTPMVSYTRGVDFSGSFQGAGGIGGLLARSHEYSGGSWSTHNFYHSDGNGNITYLLNSSQGMSALYRYDPYGRLLYSSGSLAGANLYRFSSKEIHVNSGLYYYGYRFYDPNLQRWLNRDPIGEEGGRNLYVFVRNAPLNVLDPDGKLTITVPWWTPHGAVAAASGAVGWCLNRYLCRRRIELAFGFAEAQAHANAPDETLHRPTGDPTRPVVAGGDADTLTHCIASCDVAKSPGLCGGLDRTLDFLQAREVGNVIETQLDRLNNEMGFALGMNNPDKCTDACLDWLRRGLLYEIRNGQIVPSSVEE